jgi:hypothetical protein
MTKSQMSRVIAAKLQVIHPVPGHVVLLSKSKKDHPRVKKFFEEADDAMKAQLVGEVLATGPTGVRQLMTNRRAYAIVRAMVIDGTPEQRAAFCDCTRGHAVTLASDRSAVMVMESLLKLVRYLPGKHQVCSDVVASAKGSWLRRMRVHCPVIDVSVRDEF